MESAATEINVFIIVRLLSRTNPAMRSGTFIAAISVPTFRSVTKLIIVAIPVTPPGAMLFGAVKQ